MTSKILGWCSFVLLTGLYVYMVIAAVGNLTQLPQMAAQMGLGVNAIGKFWLWVGVLLPVVVYLIALLAGVKRRGGARLLLLLTALAFVAALQLEMSLLVSPIMFFE